MSEQPSDLKLIDEFMKSDLKLIDELLCVLRSDRRLTWKELANSSFAARQALDRLRKAYASGEMLVITLSLAKEFERLPCGHAADHMVDGICTGCRDGGYGR